MSAYLIVEIEVTDPGMFEEYRRQVTPMIQAYGGRYIVRGGAAELLEGSPEPERIVVVEFPSMERLKAFHDAPEYAPLIELRRRSAVSRLVAVEGV